MRCGHVALLGRPNAGKSTLLNACIGQKIAGVSKRPQTTRDCIMGIRTSGETQILFYDTPGVELGRNRRPSDRILRRTAFNTIETVDAICYLVDIVAGWSTADTNLLAGILGQATCPVQIFATKIDRLKKHDIAQRLAQITEEIAQSLKIAALTDEQRAKLVTFTPAPLSAKSPVEVTKLCELLSGRLPERAWLYAEDDLTDRSQNFVIAEMIREQVFRHLGQEVPFGCALSVEEFEDKPTIVVIKAAISVAKESHKGIVIGKQGSTLKAIGTESRKTLERHFSKKVFLELFVDVGDAPAVPH